MPCDSRVCYGFHYDHMSLAKAQVRAKFPALQEGTSGWHRAVDNRLRRLKGR